MRNTLDALTQQKTYDSLGTPPMIEWILYGLAFGLFIVHFSLRIAAWRGSLSNAKAEWLRLLSGVVVASVVSVALSLPDWRLAVTSLGLIIVLAGIAAFVYALTARLLFRESVSEQWARLDAAAQQRRAVRLAQSTAASE